MSMPKLPNPDEILSRDEALNAIQVSIAMEETALAQIMAAESEKLRFVMKHINPKDECHMRLLLQFNASVSNMIEQINDMQLILKNKLRLTTKCMPCPPITPCPPVPPPECETIFTACGCWIHCKLLDFKHENNCYNGVKLKGKNQILLPGGKKYKVVILLKMYKDQNCPVAFEIKQECICGCKKTFTKRYELDGKHTVDLDDGQVLDAMSFNFGRKSTVEFNDTLLLTSLGKHGDILSLRLLSLNEVMVRYSKIAITVLPNHDNFSEKLPD